MKILKAILLTCILMQLTACFKVSANGARISTGGAQVNLALAAKLNNVADQLDNLPDNELPEGWSENPSIVTGPPAMP